MADIPLNHFVRKAFTLSPIVSAYYTAPFDRAAVILNAYITNNTPKDITVTAGISGVGSANAFVDPLPYYDYAKNILIPGYDTLNLVPSKIILEQFDTLIVSASLSGVVLNLSLLETINTVA